MSFMPPVKSSEEEFYKWVEVNPGLEGMVVSLDELKHFFPSKSGESEIEVTEEHDNYRVYGKQTGIGQFKFPQNIAYQCNNCDNLIIGHPLIKKRESLCEEDLNQGNDIYCCECNNHLKS
jgi:hypothetical protein